MNSNTCSPEGRERPPGTPPDTLAALEALVDDLAAHDRDGLPDAALAEQVLRLRRLVDRLEGQWPGDGAVRRGDLRPACQRPGSWHPRPPPPDRR
jgi:hypothetical protein